MSIYGLPVRRGAREPDRDHLALNRAMGTAPVSERHERELVLQGAREPDRDHLALNRATETTPVSERHERRC